MHQSGSVSLCRSAISVLVATALYSPIALHQLLSMVRQLMVLSWKKISSWFVGPPIIRKSILAENSIYKNLV